MATLEEHMRSDEKFQESIGKDISTIKENHLHHIEADIATVKIDLSAMKVNVDWLMRYHWIVIGASVGAVVTGLINLLK